MLDNRLWFFVLGVLELFTVTALLGGDVLVLVREVGSGGRGGSSDVNERGSIEGLMSRSMWTYSRSTIVTSSSSPKRSLSSSLSSSSADSAAGAEAAGTTSSMSSSSLGDDIGASRVSCVESRAPAREDMCSGGRCGGQARQRSSWPAARLAQVGGGSESATLR